MRQRAIRVQDRLGSIASHLCPVYPTQRTSVTARAFSAVGPTGDIRNMKEAAS